MQTVPYFKENALIRGVDVHISFYERLMALLQYVAQPEELVELKKASPEQWHYHLETLLILFNTMDELAREQGLVEERPLPEDPAPEG